MSDRMTRRFPLCCPEVVLENGVTIDIRKLAYDEPTVATGTVIDRLYEYEHIGTPEYFRKLVNKDRVERARKLAMNSIFGGYGTMVKIGEEDQFKAITDRDITKMYPTTMFTPEYFARCYFDTDSLWPKVNPNLKKSWGKPALPEIDHVIFNNPATIVFWKDNTKTVVKANAGEPYDPEKGLAMAMVKKVSGNKGNYYNAIRKELDKNPYDNSEVCHIKDYANMYHCLRQCEVNVRNSYANLVGVLNNKKATKADLIEAIELSIGRLSELVDEGGPLD